MGYMVVDGGMGMIQQHLARSDWIGGSLMGISLFLLFFLFWLPKATAKRADSSPFALDFYLK